MMNMLLTPSVVIQEDDNTEATMVDNEEEITNDIPIDSNITTNIGYNVLKTTFYITYVLLITTGTITFIEALRASKPEVRHIMNVETCISIVAAFFYSIFISKLQKYEEENEQLDFDEINDTRYADWFISTPLMLLVLMMVLGYQNNKSLHIWSYFAVIAMNFMMLLSGYLGDKKMLNGYLALILGFVFFFGIFGFIWMTYFTGAKINYESLFIYGTFFVVWSFYGVLYLGSTYTKNITYNILDVIAKCFVGIFFWMYFTGILVY